MRSINLRLILVSVGLLGIIAMGANLLHGIQLRRSASILLEQGTQRIKEGRPGHAIDYLSRYTILVPHNVDAQILLADTLSELGQPEQAIKWYEKALLRDAGRHEARRRLVELAISIHDYAKAKSNLLDYLLPYTPNDPRVYYLLGVSHEGIGEFGPAMKELQEAINRDPVLTEAYTHLATLFREQHKSSDDADALMEQLVAKSPTSAKVRLARADYRAKFHLTGVLDDVREAVRLAPEDTEVLFRAARTALDLALTSSDQAPLFAESDRYVRKGMTITPRFAGWYLALAQADRGRGQMAEAIKHIEEGLSAVPDNGDLQWNLADLILQQERFEEGLGIAQRLGDQGYPKVPLEYLLAVADARRMRYVDAVERWRRVRGQMDQWPELARQTDYWLGTCYEHLGEYGLELTSFRNAVKVDPAWVPARQWLATSLARTGRIDEAITEYEELSKLTGVPHGVLQDLAKLLVLRQLQRRSEQRDWPSVVSFLDRASKLDTESDQYTILRAEVQAAQQLKDAAHETLTNGTKTFPKSTAVRLALAALEQSRDQWEVAENLISETKKQFGDSVDVRVSTLRYLVQRQGVDAYDRLQALEKDTFKGNLADEQRWRTSLAAAYYTLGKFPDAGRLWQQAVEKEPDNILFRMFLFDLALADRDEARMKQLLSEIGRIERSEERPLWRYGEATRLVMRARAGDISALSEAERLLEEVRAARQMWSRIPLLQAEINDIRGEYDKVVEQYLAAIDLGERSPTIIRRVVELLYRQRRYAEADSVLRKFEATQLPITGDLGRLAADVSFRVQDFSRAMQIAIQVIGNSDSYDDLVWMAQLHSVMGQVKPAEDKLQAAIKKQPKRPDAWIALVQHFVRTRSLEKARLAIETLAKNVDKESVVFVEAICLDALGDTSAAMKQFNDATRDAATEPIILRVAADFYLSHGRPTKAEPLLTRLLANKSVAKRDVSWGKRNLAIVWATTGDIPAKTKAVALIDENLHDNASSNDDRRAKAICRGALGGKANSEAALAIIQELINSRQSTPADLLLAFGLCVKLDRLADARRYLEELTFANSKDPQNLVRYIDFVLGRDDQHEAAVWIRRLRDVCANGIKNAAPTNLRERQQFHNYLVVAAGLDARLMIKQGDTKSAIALLIKQAGNDANASTERLTIIEAAQILETISLDFVSSDKPKADEFCAAAEWLLRSKLKVSTTDTVALIAFLTRQNRVTEAIDLWKDQFTANAAEDFAIAAAALAGHSGVNRQDLTEMTNSVKSVRGDHPSRGYLAGLSQLLCFQGEHAEAIAVYREMRKLDPNDLATTNNLACYLALSGNHSNEALELINGAIDSEGTTGPLLDSRGMILLEMGRAEEALRDLERAVIMTPTAPTYLHLAAALKELKQHEKSDTAMVQAVKMGLRADQLHPLERARYVNLLKQASL
jgi:cellulose synthase operon protein C